MFCINCGKELSDKARFCKYCGTSMEEDDQKTEPTQMSRISKNNHKAFVFDEFRTQGIGIITRKYKMQIISIVLMVFICLCGFLPIISATAAGESFNICIYGMGKLIKKAERAMRAGAELFGSGNEFLYVIRDKLDGIKLFYGLFLCFWITSIGFMGLSIKEIYDKGITKRAKLFAQASSAIGGVIVVILWLAVKSLNEYIEEQLYGLIIEDIFSITFIGLLIFVCSAVNIFVIIPRIPKKRGKTSEFRTESICLKCGMEYRIGERCPNCGSISKKIITSE